MRTVFNDNWLFNEFELNTSFDKMNASDSLYPVDVPHDWMIWHVEDLYKNSIGFYKKSFDIHPVDGHTYIIRFEGVYMDSKVYLNGKEIFEWKYGYSTFDVNLTHYLIDGENQIAVSCTYQNPNSRWYSGAGIYRNVYFYDKNEAYITNDGIYASTKKIDNDFEVTVDADIITPGRKMVSVVHSVLDKDGKEIASNASPFPISDATRTVATFTVKSPRLWDIKDPYVYTLKTELFVDGKLMDTAINPLGFRTIRFDNNEGFFLNDRNVKINGACEHHDLGALGSAMNKTALRRQFKKLIEMGVNSIRTSHNMPAKEIMELADEMGILIYSESFDMWEKPKTEFDYANYFPTWYERDVSSWVKRDINHPSLIIWGIGNEIYDTHDGNGLKWTRLLRDAVRKIDYRHNAYIGIGSNYIEWENAQKCSDELELSGYNYGERLYDLHHKKYPHWCIFGSETSSTVQSRGIYHFPLETHLLTHEDAQCSCLGNCTTNWGARDTDIVITEHRDHDFVFGQYIWTGWDYIGEPTPYFSKNSFFGQIDTAGFEKDTFYHYQAEWTSMEENPMVHLLPYWDFNEGQIIDVIAYSNAPYVELFLNDKSLGKQFIDHKHGLSLKACWKVPYYAGTLKAVATDENGNIVATDYQSSFGDPVKLTASCDKTDIVANGEDLIFISISAEDESGTFVANARNRINVGVTGSARLVGLDNGDSTDYEEYKGSSRKLFSGRLLAIIASTGEAGDITVDISSDSLKPVTLKLTSKAYDGPVVPCLQKNFVSPERHDIPVRKISLKNEGTFNLNENEPMARVSFEIYPKNATYKDIRFVALTKDSVEANFVDIHVDGNEAVVKALGDGCFSLFAFANNGKDHAEVISSLDFSITGMGFATFNPYELIPGCSFTKAHSNDTKLSFSGGVFLPEADDQFVTYENVDFGEYGSDEVTLPIFSFRDSFELDVFEGDFETGENLGHFTYNAKSWYNHYQENTFKLSRRIKGCKSVTFVFHVGERISLQGFKFTRLQKAYSVVNATENLRITGDSFMVEADAVTSIGNNVSIEFDNMDFKEGLSSVSITGKSNNDKTSIHIMFFEGDSSTRQLVEINHTDDYETFTIPLNSVNINGRISFIFLPGSNFDFKSFKFNK